SITNGSNFWVTQSSNWSSPNIFWTFRRSAGRTTDEIAFAAGFAGRIESARRSARSWTVFVDGSRRGSERWTRSNIDARGCIRSGDRRDLSRWWIGKNEKIYSGPGATRSGPTRRGTGRYQSKRAFAGTVAKHFAAEPRL